MIFLNDRRDDELESTEDLSLTGLIYTILLLALASIIAFQCGMHYQSQMIKAVETEHSDHD